MFFVSYQHHQIQGVKIIELKFIEVNIIQRYENVSFSLRAVRDILRRYSEDPNTWDSTLLDSAR